MGNIRILNHCKKCGWDWFQRKETHSTICPKCHTRLWDRERKQSNVFLHPHPNQISDTTKRAIEIRQKSPCLSSQDIAKKLGVSRERIRQILSRENLPVRRVRTFKYKCNHCGKPTNNRLFCSMKCQSDYHTISLTCDFCGKLFNRKSYAEQRNIRIHNSELIFCTKQCQGSWLANNHGFVVHPKNRGYAKGTPNFKLRKHDYDFIWQKHLETKFGATKLSRLLNIPSITISRILLNKRNGLGIKASFSKGTQPEFMAVSE